MRSSPFRQAPRVSPGDVGSGEADAPAGVRIVHEWGIPGRSVQGAEDRMIEGESVPISHEIAGYDYGLQRIEWHAFVRDGIGPVDGDASPPA